MGRALQAGPVVRSLVEDDASAFTLKNPPAGVVSPGPGI